MNTKTDTSGIEKLFLDAIEQPTIHRATFVDRACEGDDSMRSEVLKLLQGHEWADEVIPEEGLLADEVGVDVVDDAQSQHTLEIGRRFAERIGRYRVIRLLGAGGMGMVFLAEQEKPKRLVALKVVRPGVATSKMLRRFEMESQVLGRLQHPGIAQIYEADTADTGEGPQPYFVMEYVRGMPLLEYAKRRGYRTQERLELLTRICSAIQHAHRRGVIHRDLKPTNILVTDDGEPKILDFGVARTTDLDIQTTSLCTDVGQLVGTVPYMSPEQTLGDPEELDTRSDVYALGVIGYELLAGRPPYDLTKKMIHEAIHVIREAAPTPLSVVNRVFRGDLETIFGKALAKEPSRRYQSVSDLADDINHYLHDEPIEARPPSTSYQLRKFARRHRVSVTAGVAMAITLMLGTTVSSIGFVQANHEREQAVSDRDAAQEARIQAQSDRDRAIAAEREAHRQAYVANLFAADASLYFHEASEAKQRLAACIPDLRGWEWWHLNSRTDRSILKIDAHDKLIWSVAVSPDGLRFASASADKTIGIWDAKSGESLKILQGHESEVNCVAFSPDGHRIASSSDDKTVRVWDAVSGECVMILRGHDDWVSSVEFSPDGSRLVSGSGDKTIRLWDADSGELQATLVGHTKVVKPVVFSPDGSKLVSASFDMTVRLWDAATGEYLATVARYEGFTHPIALAFSPDGERIYTGSGDKLIRVWDATTGTALESLTGHDVAARAIVVSRDGSRIVTGSGGATIRIWDAESRRELGTLVGHEGWISSVAISPDGTTVVSASGDGTIRTWSAVPSEWPTISVDHGRQVNDVAFSPDGKRIASCSRDRMVRIWDADTGDLLRTLEGHSEWVMAVAFDPSGGRIASGATDGTVRLWDETSGELLRTLEGHMSKEDAGDMGDMVFALAYNHDGSRIASGSRRLRIWDAASGEQVKEIKCASEWIVSLAYSPDGSRIVTSSVVDITEPDIDTIQVWDVESGEPIVRWQADGRWGTVVYSADGRQVIGKDGRRICIWDATSGEKLVVYTSDSYGDSIAVFGDGKRIVSGGDSLRVWDAATGDLLLALRVRGYSVGNVAISPDGRRIVTGAVDGAVRIWDTTPEYEPGPALQVPE